MAKKKPATAASDAFITCGGYTLDVRNSNHEFIFELDVQDEAGNEFFLRVKQLNDRTGLVQRVLRTIADRWPAFDWEFKAGGDGSITDIR